VRVHLPYKATPHPRSEVIQAILLKLIESQKEIARRREGERARGREGERARGREGEGERARGRGKKRTRKVKDCMRRYRSRA
jgi:hypothetical protein